MTAHPGARRATSAPDHIAGAIYLDTDDGPRFRAIAIRPASGGHLIVDVNQDDGEVRHLSTLTMPAAADFLHALIAAVMVITTTTIVT